jgi:hypothetical protein
MPLAPLDVIIIPDETIEPPGPKMVVCIHPANGWFYRINTKSHWHPSIALNRLPDHSFLDHDSFLQCGDFLDLDDYVIEQSMNREGIIGKISPLLCGQIITALAGAIYVTESDKSQIRNILQPLIAPPPAANIP